MNHLKRYMILRLLLNFPFALVLRQMFPIVFHFDKLVYFDHYLDSGLLAQQVALKIMIIW